MIGTEKLRKENQELRKEIQDLNNQLKKITDDMLNFPLFALVLISYFARIVPPRIASLAAGSFASVILSVY